MIASVSEFIYLGSKITTDGHSAPEVMRRIALAASAMISSVECAVRNFSLVANLCV